MYENTPVADGFDSMVGLDQSDTLTAEGLWLPQGYGDVGFVWYSANDLGNFYYLGPDKTNPALHTGVDLNLRQPGNSDADRLRPVYSPANAVVTYAANRPSSWGNLMVLRTEYDGQLYWMRFGHFQEMKRRSGEVISRGSLLGYVGNGGGRYPYHLHADIVCLNSKLHFSVLEPPATAPQYGAWHWPGMLESALFPNYLAPLEFIRVRRPGMKPPPRLSPLPESDWIEAISLGVLNVRSTPSPAGRLLRAIPAGQRFYVLSLTPHNGYVELGEEVSGQRGYVIASGVMPTRGADNSVARVVKSTANVRRDPSIANNIDGQVYAGNFLLVTPSIKQSQGYEFGRIVGGKWDGRFVALSLTRAA